MRAVPLPPAADPLRVLLIEDSGADAGLVLDLLEDELPGADVDVRRSLAEALAALPTAARHPPPYDVVLADLSLPDAEGLAVVEAVLDRAPHAALLVLTGRDDRDLALASLSSGAQDYLVKGQHDGQRLATAIRHAVQRRQAELRARRYERLAGSLLDGLESPTCAVDARGAIVAVNAAWLTFGKVNDGDSGLCGPGSSYLDACAAAVPGPDGAVARDIGEGLRQVLSGEIPRYARDYPCHSPEEDRWFSVRIGPLELDDGPGAVVMHVDVTAMHQAQEALSHQALHDGLTGLPNRLLLVDRLTQALNDTARRGTQVAVAFVDLDHFKRVNDSLGHQSGDRLLQEVATRLSAQLRAGDTLARFSGDEFVVIWRDLHDGTEGEVLSQRLSVALSGAFDLGSATVAVSASIGVVVGPARRAPTSCCWPRTARCTTPRTAAVGGCACSAASCATTAAERMSTEVGLREAITRDELVVHYSRWSTWSRAGRSRSRPWSGGSTPPAGWCHRTASSRWRSPAA